MKKKKVNQDVLYQYLLEHNITLSGLARQMDVNPAYISGCFNHTPFKNGQPRRFSKNAIPLLNNGLKVFAAKLCESYITFGSNQMFTNRLGTTYDPGTLPAIRQLSQFFNLTAFLIRVIGWNEAKKNATFSSPSSKSYGCITREEINLINAELVTIVKDLFSFQVV